MYSIQNSKRPADRSKPLTMTVAKSLAIEWKFAKLLIGCFLTVVLLSITPEAKAIPGDAYTIVVKINGQKIDGLQEALQGTSLLTSAEINQEDLRKVTAKGAVFTHLRVDSTNTINIYTKDKSGQLQEITADKNVSVIGEGIKLSSGVLKVAAAELGPGGITTMFVIYTPKGKDSQYGMNQFNLKIDSKP